MNEDNEPSWELRLLLIAAVLSCGGSKTEQIHSDMTFADLLITDPIKALDTGFFGIQFEITDEELEILIFASQQNPAQYVTSLKKFKVNL